MSDSQISDVKQKTDIVTIIGERVKLSKAGKHFKGLCPFHSERSSSFIVSPELQIFKCFGCGESGDVFSFLQKYEGMEFGEALRYLADRAGIVLQKVHTTGQKDIYFEINELASKFYHYLLTTHPSGKQALLYLQKERGLTIETIEAFQLGFAPVGTPVLYRYLTGKKHYDPQVLVKSGVISNYGGRYFDRFRGRIVFPIFTPYGKCVALAGRILPHYATKKEIPKYINSPETDIYHKSSSLYGFYQTRGDIKRTGEAIIVEGEMDLLSSWQVGVRNVVAIKGSSLTQEQATLLSRVCQKLIIALDSDFAGNAAAVRGIGITAALGLDIRVANFLPYKDPDEAARGDLSLYKDRLATSSGIWDFLLDSIFHKYSDEDSGTSTAKLSRELIPILAAIEDSVVRAHYIQFVSKRLDVPHEAVSEQLQRFLKTHEVVSSKPASSFVSEPTMETKRDLLEKQLLRIGFLHTPSQLFTSETVSFFRLPFSIKLLSFFLSYTGEYSPSVFSAALPPELFEGFSSLLLNPDEFTETTSPATLFTELEAFNLKEDISALVKKIQKAEHQKGKPIGEYEQELASLTQKLLVLTSGST